MNTKHTPGPWAVRHKLSIFPETDTALSIAVATQHRKEAEANAQLIVAAPELLAALQACVEILGPMDTIRHLEPDFPALDAARAAIARATGAAP